MPHLGEGQLHSFHGSSEKPRSHSGLFLSLKSYCHQYTAGILPLPTISIAVRPVLAMLHLDHCHSPYLVFLLPPCPLYSISSTQQTEGCVLNTGLCGSKSSSLPLSSHQSQVLQWPLNPHMVRCQLPLSPHLLLFSWSHCSGHSPPQTQAHSHLRAFTLALSSNKPMTQSSLSLGLCSNITGRGSAVFK